MKFRSTILLLCLLLLLTGCNQAHKSDQVTFYYLQKEVLYGSIAPLITAEQRNASGHTGSLPYLFSIYLQGPSTQTLTSPFPKGIVLISATKEENTLKLVLNSEFASLHNQALTLAYACIARTAESICNADTVHIIAGDEKNPLIDTVIRDDMFLYLDVPDSSSDATSLN